MRLYVHLRRFLLATPVLLCIIVSANASTRIVSAINAPGTLRIQLSWPVNGGLNSKVNSAHDGTDLNAWGGIGAPIYAAYGGKVTFAGPQGGTDCSVPSGNYGYGNIVYIDHGGGLQTRYAHLNGFAGGISSLPWVAKGQLIGYQGTTGHTNCTPHLHWEFVDTAANPIWVDISGQMSTMVGASGATTGSPVTAGGPVGFAGAWTAYNNPNPVTLVKTFTMGQPGDIPVMGDWNGDSFDTPGVVRYNVTTGNLDWRLTNQKLTSTATGTALTISTTTAFGSSGDRVVVGDFNNSGGDELGVVRAISGNPLWLLQGVPGFGFNYGVISDQPLVGDWNCDGRDTPGIARTTSGGWLQWHLNNNFDGNADYAPFNYGYGVPNRLDFAQSAAWNSATCSMPAVVRNGGIEWWYGSNLTGGVGLQATMYASENDVGIPGDWDSDVYDDIIVVS